MGITIDYYGHSCFVIGCKGYSIALDPYDSEKVPGYKPLRIKANKVLCSHDHADHNYTKAVDIVASSVANPFTVTSYEIPHDDDNGAKRGMNQIRLFEADGIRVAHFGDTGCDLSAHQADALSGLDAILVPVGGFYTIDAEKALAFRRQLQPRVFIPMHYRNGEMGYDVISALDDFIKLAGDVTMAESSRIEIEKDMPEQIVVLRNA